MFAAISRNLVASWNCLLIADLISKAVTVILLASAVSLLFQLFLQASGRTMLLQRLSLEDDVEITAHRGGARVAPENTPAGFRQAIQAQADWIEIDVQESSDGVVMVAHDSDLMKVARQPLKIGVNIQLKYYGHDQDLEQRTIALVEKYDMQEQVVFMSLEATGIAKVKRLRPTWTCGLLTAVSADDLTRAKADFLAVNRSLATRQFINSAHLRSKSVAAWTVNDAQTMSVRYSRGVDNLTTDYRALARQVLQERGQWSPLERLSLELADYLGLPPPNHKF